MSESSAGTVFLDVKLKDEDFIRQMAGISANASKVLQQEFNRGLDLSSIAKDMAQEAKRGVANVSKVASNIQMPKMRVELDRTQLERELSAYSQKWEAIDNQRIAQTKKIAQIRAGLERESGSAEWDREAAANATKLEGELAKAERKLADIKLEAMRTDQVIVQLERNIASIGTATNSVNPVQAVAANASAEAARVASQTERIASAASSAQYATKKVGSASRSASRQMSALGRTGQVAGAQISAGMDSARHSASGFEKATQAAGIGLKKMVRFGLGMMGIRSLMLGLRRIVNSVGDSFKVMAGQSSSLANSLNGITAATDQMKGAFASAIAPLVEMLIPVLQKVVEWLTKAFNALALFFGALAGKKTVLIATGSTKTFTDGLGGAGDAAKDTRKEVEKLKRTLAGFDELEVLSFDKGGSDDGSGGGSGGGGSGGGQPIFEEVPTGLGEVGEGIQKIISQLQSLWSELSKTKAWKTFEKSAKKAWENVKTSASKAWNNISSAWEDTKPKLIKSWNTLAPKFAELWTKQASYVWLPLISGATGAFLEIGGSFIANVIKGIGSFAKLATAILAPFIDSLNNFWDAHGEEIANKIYSTFDTLKTGVTEVFDAIGEVFDKVFGGLRDWFVEHGPEIEEMWTNTWETIRGFVEPIWTEIEEVAGQIFGAISSFFNENSEEIKNAIVDTWNAIWKIVKPIWNTILKVAKQIFGGLQEWWGEHGESVKGIFSSAWNFITDNFMDSLALITNLFEIFGALFSGDWAGLWEGIKSLAVNLWEKLGNRFSNTLDIMTNAFSVLGIDISGITESLKGIFSGLTTFLSGVFTGDWAKAWEGVKEIFSNIWEGIKAVFILPINWIIDKLNWFIRQLNKIKIPDWVPGIGGLGINIGEIAQIQLARGGIVEQPTLAMVGEAGKEAVMPLEHNTGWISKLAAEIAALNGGGEASGGGGDTNLSIPIYLGTDTLVGVLEAAIDREGRLRNKPVFS